MSQHQTRLERDLYDHEDEQVGPNLDNLRPPKELVLDAIKNGRSKGNGQMAADLYEGQDAIDVANFVAKAVGSTPAKP